MVGESDKEDNRKPAAKKRLQNNNDVYVGTTTRAKMMRLENHANESEVCETKEFQRSIKTTIGKWHTKEQHMAFITKIEKLRDEAIMASTRNYYDYLIKESIKERGYKMNSSSPVWPA